MFQLCSRHGEALRRHSLWPLVASVKGQMSESQGAGQGRQQDSGRSGGRIFTPTFFMFHNEKLIFLCIAPSLPDTEQTQGGMNDILLPKGPPLFLQGFPPPTRFTLPITRGKTSLNVRDW